MVDIIIRLDNYLFLDNDSNRSVDQIEGRLRCSERFQNGVRLCHESRRLIAQSEYGGRYFHAIVPNKETVLRNVLGPRIRWAREGLPPVFAYKQRFPQSLSFFAPDFADARQPERCYSKCDTHWSDYGAHQYLRLLLRTQAPELADRLDAIAISARTSKTLGDLGSKLDGWPPEEIELLSPREPKARLAFTNALQNDGCVKHYVNETAPIDAFVVLNHDSTSHALMPWLAELFSSLLCIHCADVDTILMADLRPRYHFFIQIERFFLRAPRNEFNLVNFLREEETRKTTAVSAVDYIAALQVDRLRAAASGA